MPTNTQHQAPNRTDWLIREDTNYLNHGSFSPALNCVREARRQWIDRLDEQPMDFFLRQFEPAMEQAIGSLARFVGTQPSDLVLVDNATYAMNVVAQSFQLNPGDQVLINNHEYGAVFRIWERACQQAGAELVVATLPTPIVDPQSVVDDLTSKVTDRTKLLIVSHITSATALILPIEQITAEFRNRGIAVCVDGPHAPAQVPLNIEELGCDFYCASCHKWMCGPLGTGFLYVNPRQQSMMQPPIKSWGRLLPAIPERWNEEFTWIGTRDPSVFLSIPTAIEFMESHGLDAFRNYSRNLATETEQRLMDRFGTQPLGSREHGWYGSMVHVPLPDGDWSQLQHGLWQQNRIEIPVINFEDQWYIRVSCHWYVSTEQIDHLMQALDRQKCG